LLVEIARACPDMVFTWVGGGDVPAGLSIPGNLRLTGMLPHAEALAVLAESDVYIHTSRWEGLSNAILEAMALALPVVVSPVSQEVVCTELGLGNGFVCVQPADYVRALRTFGADASAVAAAGCNSRRLAEQRYAPDVVLEKWRRLYASEAGRA
jgi:glycosyltransferase involved in cell wall biosynthesis